MGEVGLPGREIFGNGFFEGICRNLIIWLNKDSGVEILHPAAQGRGVAGGFEIVGHGQWVSGL